MDETIITDKLGTALSEITDTLKNAVTEYGPDAVDLALMAFRVEAFQQLAWGVLLLIPALVYAISFKTVWAQTAKLTHWENADRGAARLVYSIAGGIISVFTSLPGLNYLMDISAWAAAIGYPELHIAMKSLEAAGLM